MPARKYREGAELEEWLARKERRHRNQAIARQTVLELTGHTLLRPREVAAMLSVTTKTLREMEKRGELPPRVTLSPSVFGWRLSDLEALIEAKMAIDEVAT